MIFLYASGTIAHNAIIRNPKSDSFVSNNPLVVINEIRNVFAHSPHNITLRNKVLWDKVLTIRVACQIVNHRKDDKKSREAVLKEALLGYALMLCHDRHRRRLLPEYKGKFLGFEGGNTLRF